MDLFGLIVNYLYTYIFYPIGNALNEEIYMSNPLFSKLYVIDGKITWVNSVFDESGVYTDYYITYSAEGTRLQSYDGFTLIDLLAFLTTIVIFILLFIVAVKFIVWLFKQISFITRF